MIPPPKSTPLLKYPATTTLPLPSKARQLAVSSLAAPIFLAQRNPPVEEYLAMNISVNPALVRTPPPRLASPEIPPTTIIFPLESTAMARGVSPPVPPYCLDQRWDREDEYLAITMSKPPALVKEPPPKFAVP